MVLDMQPPDPPTLTGPNSRDRYEAIAIDEEVSDDYRREELEAILADGAWADAFEEWAASTDFAESEVELLERHGLFEQLDFYWHPGEDEVGYRVPDLSDDAREALSSTLKLDVVNAELDSLARVVSETLENDYLIRDEETYGFFADQEE